MRRNFNKIGGSNMKYINDLNTVKLLENVKQTKSYIEKKAKDENYDTENSYKILDELKKILNKTPGLVFNFFKYVIEQDVKLKADVNNDQFESIEGLVEWIKQNKATIKKLPKNLIQYDSHEKLIDDINTTIESVNTKYFWDMIKYLNYDKTDQEFIGRHRTEIDEIAIEFGKLGKDKIAKYTKKLIYFKVNSVSMEELMSDVESFIKRGSSREDVDLLVKKYRERINIVYDKDNVLMLQTEYKPAIQELGSTSWCIQYSDSYFTRYCSFNSFNTQYMIFNFNLPSTSRYSKFGITLDIDGNPLNGGHQDNINRPIDLTEISELTGVPISEFKSKKVGVKDDFIKLSKEVEGLESIDDFLDIIKYLNNEDIASELTKNFYYNRLVRMEVEGYDYSLESSLDRVKGFYDRQIPISVFKELSSKYLDGDLINEQIKRYLKKVGLDIDNFIPNFYKEIFNKHSWLFTTFIDDDNITNDNRYQIALNDQLSGKNEFNIVLITNIMIFINKEITKEKTDEDKVKKFISILSQFIVLDKDYFTFIVSRFKYVFSGVDELDNINISREYFDVLRSEYKMVFDEIEDGVLENKDTKSSKYEYIQNTMLNFLDIGDKLELLSSYNSASLINLVKSLEDLYKLHKIKGDEYFEKDLDYTKKLVEKIGGVNRNVFMDGDEVYSIQEIEANPVLKWAKDFLFNLVYRKKFLVFYIYLLTQKNFIKEIENLMSYDINIISDYKEDIFSKVSDFKLTPHIFREFYRLFKSDYLTEMIDNCIDLLLASNFDNTTLDELKEILSIVDDEIDYDYYAQNIFDKAVLNLYEEGGIIEFCVDIYNENDIEISLEDYEREREFYFAFLELVYSLLKRLEPSNIGKYDVFSVIGFNQGDITAKNFAKIMGHSYNEDLDCFLYKVENLTDLNFIFDESKGTGFVSDENGFDVFYQGSDFEWNNGFDSIDVENIMYISNILLEVADELTPYRDLITNFDNNRGDIRDIEDIEHKARYLLVKNLIKEFQEENIDIYNELESVIEEILEEDEYDVCTEIINFIESSQAVAQSRADESDHHDMCISALPDCFLYKDINGESTRYTNDDAGNKTFFIDIEELVELALDNYSNYDYEMGESYSLEDFIKYNMALEGLERPPSMDSYVTPDDYDLNERLSDLLGEIDIPTNENIIIRFKDFN